MFEEHRDAQGYDNTQAGLEVSACGHLGEEIVDLFKCGK
jgi:hypothetical protein